MGQEKKVFSRNEISSSHTRKEINCHSKKLIMGKEILATPLSGVSRIQNKISNLLTKEKLTSKRTKHPRNLFDGCFKKKKHIRYQWWNKPPVQQVNYGQRHSIKFFCRSFKKQNQQFLPKEVVKWGHVQNTPAFKIHRFKPENRLPIEGKGNSDSIKKKKKSKNT